MLRARRTRKSSNGFVSLRSARNVVAVPRYFDHLSCGGSYYAGDFDFMPINSNGFTSAPTNRYAFDTPFSHTNETARPGYYAVTLDNGIKIELTATTRSGCGSSAELSSLPAGRVTGGSEAVSGDWMHVDPR